VDDDDGDGYKVPTGDTEEEEVLELGGDGSKRNWRSEIVEGSGRELVVETEFFDVDGTLGRGRIVCRGDCVKMRSALSTKFKWPAQVSNMVLDLFGRPPVGVATLVDALRPVLLSLVLLEDAIVLATLD
jgi:hypothetical protein